MLFGAADRLWQRCFASPGVAIPIVHKKFLSVTREALGQAEFDQAFAEGRSLPIDVATALAMEEPKAGQVGDGDRWDPLTDREAEVARLVADGLTNREIAEKLVIAPRTAESHVQNILVKLAFSRRSQVAVWAVERMGQAAVTAGFVSPVAR
jgi:DNA-binding NarL/FixJ family response regulator